ncbi:MAG: hypothetical protein GXO02_01305, partial [Epsilonproteobacteria bacterium]|nr:hypothetical protein [Campylobacterota bacterium]
MRYTFYILVIFVVVGCGGGSSSSQDTMSILSDEQTYLSKSFSILEDNNLTIEEFGSIFLIKLPANGDVVVEGESLIYIPNRDFFGKDSFSYRVDDTFYSVDVEVIGVNDEPVAIGKSLVVSVDTPLEIGLEAEDSDSKELVYEIISHPKFGSLEGTAPNLIYTPNSGFKGVDSFEFRVWDGELFSNIAKVEIEVSDEVGLVKGRVTFDYVPNEGGLDFYNISQKPIRGVVVELVDDSSKEVLKRTFTNGDGEYRFDNVALGKRVKVRVRAQLNDYDIKVVDNTSNWALYVLEGESSIVKGEEIRNLNASCGWVDGEYKLVRAAAPFAILDTIYEAILKVSNDISLDFPPLRVNWSPYNRPARGDITNGEIITTHYSSSGDLYVLGDSEVDSDEYDRHVILHEFAHYFEYNFGRFDNIGGPHNIESLLDIRVAFSEGMANALSGYFASDPIYIDSYSTNSSEYW